MPEIPERVLSFVQRYVENKTQFCELPLFSEAKGSPKTLTCYPLIEEISFYSGHTVSQSEYTPDSARSIQHSKLEREKRIKNEVDLSEILSRFEAGHIAFVGPAGSGKTILLRNIAWRIYEDHLIKGIRLVFYTNCQDNSRGEMTTTKEMFFGYMTDEEANECIEYATTNPKEVLFVIDSLDTLQFSPDGVYEYEDLEMPSAMNNPAYPEILLAQFLSDDLFPNCRKITSTREYSIRNYFGNIRPDKVLALIGFRKEDIIEVMSKYIEDEAMRIDIVKIINHNQLILSICSNPFMLKTLLFIWKSGNKHKLQTITITKILDLLFTCLLNSEHYRDGSIEEKFVELLNIANLANSGTQKGRIIFSSQQLEECDVLPDKSSNFGVLSPANPVHRAVKNSAQVYFFVHKCFQELFTAMHIARTSIDSFRKIVKFELHRNPKFAAVRRYLYGLLFGMHSQDCTFAKLLQQKKDGTCHAGETNDLDEKRKILVKTMIDELKEVKNSADRIELFAALYESEDAISQMVGGKINEVRLERIPLTPCDMISLAAVLRCYEEVKELKLTNCTLEAQQLQTLSTKIRNSNLKITEFYVTNNIHMGEEGTMALGESVKATRVEILHIENCGMQTKHLKSLKKALAQTKLKRLGIIGEVRPDDEMVDAVSSMLSNVQELLLLRLWKFKLEQKTYLEKKLDEIPVGSYPYPMIEINRYETLKRKSTIIQVKHQTLETIFKEIEEILPTTYLAELELRDCEVSRKILQSLKNVLTVAGSKIRKLTISSTQKMEVLLPTITDLSTAAYVSELNLEETDVTADMLSSAKENMKNLRQLNLSHNELVGFKLLADVLNQWSTSELILMECQLTASDLETLGPLLKQGLTVLDISYNPDIEPEGFGHVAKILQDNEDVTLSLSGCDLNCSKFDALCEGMETKETKVRYLDVSYNDVSGTLLCLLIDFAEQKSVKELELGGCGLGCDEIEILHSKLRRCEVSYLGLSDNASIDDSMSLVGAMVKDCGISRMDISNCMLGERRISEFVENLEEKISFLNLSDCDKKVSCRYAKALCKVIPHVTNRLVLHFGEFSTAFTEMIIDQKKALNEGLKLHLEPPTKEESHRGFSISFRKADDQ